MDGSFASLDGVAKSIPTTLPNWFISSINYVSFNVAVGASMAIVMGGAEKNPKTAAWGGLVGGLVLGIMIMLIHLAISQKLKKWAC
ncbi:putative membrane protein YkvI OS=Ureibacillus acetophenoni OX=614649 GN=SAMN05877842_11094 PE=4 SV=1 [Ureibacillus acetophenoni]